MNLKTTAKSIIIACAMIITPFCSAFAEEETNEVKIITSDGSSIFDSWENISNLNDNNYTIVLQKDIEPSKSVTISKNCTIDLNGHTITIKDDNLIEIKGVEVTINGGGGIKRNEESDNSIIINIEISPDEIAGSLIINGGEYSGTITNSYYGGNLVINDGEYNGTITNDGNLVINDGEYNGTITNGGNLVINGGTFSNNSTIIDGRTMGNGNVFIYGGTFDNSNDGNDTSLIEVSGGFVLIAGGDFTSNGNVVHISTGELVSLGLYNGTFTSKNSSPINLEDANNIDGAILVGGTYTAADGYSVFPNYDGENSIVADGLSVYDDENGKVVAEEDIKDLTGGSYTVKSGILEKDAVASLTIGEETTYYSSLPLAFTVAQGASEATITLCKDSYLEGEEYIHFETGNITFDLNGHEVSCSSEYLITVGNPDKPYLHPQLTIVDNEGEGSLNSVNTAVIVANGATLTINGGSFNNSIQADYSTLTINDGTFNVEQGSINVWNSTLTINDGTFSNSIEASYSTLTINDGTFSNFIQASISTLTINGGTFKPISNTVVIISSEFNIAGGDFNCSNNSCLNIIEESSGSITGGTFSSGGSYSIINTDNNNLSGILPEGYIFYDERNHKEIECELRSNDQAFALFFSDQTAAAQVVTLAKVKGMFDIENADDLYRTLSTISENPQQYGDANINILGDIKLENNVTIDNNNNVDLSGVPSYNLGTAEYPFQGTVKGNGYTIENLVAQTDSKSGIFGFIGDSSYIENLNLKAQVFINSIFGNKDASTEPVEVPLFFGSNKGQVKGLSFVGQVYFDEALGDAELTWVGNNEEGASFSNSFVYFTEEGETKSATIGDNKVCVVLKQNMRVGKGKGRTYKVCSGPKSTKAAIEVNPDNPDDAEILSDTRECTAEQFANGEVAYWLNYDGKGYSNDYNKIWSQGNEYPVLATEKNKYLVKLLYVVNNGKYADSFAAPYFANVGTTVTISYTTQPESITVDGVEIFQSGNKARTRADVDHIGAFNFAIDMNKAAQIGESSQSFIVPETAEGKGIVTVNINFPAETAIAQHTDSEANIAVAGNRIVISNAVGQDIKLYDLAGHCLVSEQAPSEEVTIIVPEKGVYIVKAGNKTEKIIVR